MSAINKSHSIKKKKAVCFGCFGHEEGVPKGSDLLKAEIATKLTF